MKTKTLLFTVAFLLGVSTFSQQFPIELTFAANYYGEVVILDSILIENLTQGGDTMLYEPLFVEVEEHAMFPKKNFSVTQNYPNPFTEKTTFSIFMPEEDLLQVIVFNSLGKKIVSYKQRLEGGNHSFSFYSGNERNYFVTASMKGSTRSIKLVSLGNTSSKECSLTYSGKDNPLPDYKAHKEINDFEFSLGDTLRFTGFDQTPLNNIGSDVIEDAPEVSTLYTFDIIEGLRCPGTPSITDIDENVYNTVLIGTQCWMKEDLKTTTYRNGTPIPNVTDNTEWSTLTTGAYAWYDNDIGWKDLYGAFYNGFAVFDTNGLCPSGWHIPTDLEWVDLANFIGGMSSPHGNLLKSCRQVNSPLGGDCSNSDHPRWNDDPSIYGTDDFGFSGLPNGLRWYDGPFGEMGEFGGWQSSTPYLSNASWHWYLKVNTSTVNRVWGIENFGVAARCLKDLDD